MIFEEPVFKPLADCYLGVYFGDEADMALNFRVLALLEVLEREQVDGIVEVIPTVTQLGIVIDRRRISHGKLEETIRRLLPDVEQTGELSSRLLRIPVWYDDPWSAEMAERFDVPRNIDFVAEHNGIDIAAVIERHTGGEQWVPWVGFVPGCYVSYPLDPANQLSAPKYKTPRSDTPARALSLAGLATATYPFASPGGFQLIGRLPVEIYEPVPRNDAFPPDGVLMRPGDRIQYLNIGPAEYERLREESLTG
ncbi:MAG: carboxyltransferase domain-containing protein, partial [Microvirga sp.]